MPQLTNDVTRFNRTNDVQIRALLQPGTNFGLTDLQLAVTEPPRNTLQLFFDNQGVQTTGRNQGGVYYKLHGLAGIDDRLTFYGVKSEGNLNATPLTTSRSIRGAAASASAIRRAASRSSRAL